MNRQKEFDRIFLQLCSDEESEWCGEVTWCEDRINDDDVEYVSAKQFESLRQQLAECQKENERLKTVPMKYRRMAFNAQLQDENARLNKQLAACQAALAHWKNNHATEVRRARILKERTDMPLERVHADR